jgi:TalC/MipB family fructose-6-phosphate aldolase
MELYLDSADLREIEDAFTWGFLAGLTTTPTFMHRHGITDVDSLVLKLAGMVPVLQVEALGKNEQEIISEANRLVALGLDPKKTVFKIPVSLEGIKACKKLTSNGMMVNIHLVYTLQQAYMAMTAGATYVCPLVGRLQDQGHDALDLVQQCVEAANYYGYDSKIMFSSVRHPEHVRNAINIGVHTVTVPYKVLKMLPENNLTTLGTEQFFEHTKMMTVKVKEIAKPVMAMVTVEDELNEAIIKMSEFGFGCVAVSNTDGKLIGAFTDGDLRRQIQEKGRQILQYKMGDFEYKSPVTISTESLLNEAAELFKKHGVDNLIIINPQGEFAGILDIQDIK